jgi:ssDNA-binding Zn-finger/Zn-ribbon topoisomerase 1
MSRNSDAEAALLGLGCLGGLFYGVGCVIAAVLRIPVGWGVVCAVVLLFVAGCGYGRVAHLRRQREMAAAERSRQERAAWLQTPEGVAWAAEERERQRRHQEEVERQRREAEEHDARARWILYFESKSMADLAKMTGLQFEQFLERLFYRMGYTDIKLTPTTNDQGGDLVCRSPSGAWVAVQAKRWKSSVGIEAVQQIYAALRIYNCTQGMVVTNSTFTPAAYKLAKANHITLRDGRWLAEQIKTYLPPEIPPFDWAVYRREVESFRPVEETNSCPACSAPMRRIRSRYRRGYFYGCTQYPRCKGKANRSRPVPSAGPRPSAEQGSTHAAGVTDGDFSPTESMIDEARMASERKREEERQRQEAERRRQEQESRRRAEEESEQARRARAEALAKGRLERWIQSDMAREWVLEHLDGWDQVATAKLFERVKATPYWPLDPVEMVLRLQRLRAELGPPLGRAS